MYSVWNKPLIYINIRINMYIYILVDIKRHYFMHFWCLFLKFSKVFGVSLSRQKPFKVKSTQRLFAHLQNLEEFLYTC